MKMIKINVPKLKKRITKKGSRSKKFIRKAKMQIILKANRIIIKVGKSKIIKRASIINPINHKRKNTLLTKIIIKNHIRNQFIM